MSVTDGWTDGRTDRLTSCVVRQLICYVQLRSVADDTMTCTVAAVITYFVLTWSRGSADDVVVSAAWLYKHLSSVFVLEATYTLTDHQPNIEHIPGQYSVYDRQ